MTVHVTLLTVLAVIGGVAWVILSFYLAAGIALLVVMGGADPEWWSHLKAAVAGVFTLGVMIGGPLAIAAWTGAWR